ncbi:MAG: CHRD domain-containing protein, partial [Thermoanaerobaculia bacterium]
MKKALLLLVALVLLAPAAAAQTYSAGMAGGPIEVPPGDPDGTGVAVVRINGNIVQWEVGVANIAAPTVGHIHRGGPGVAGPVVIGFDPLIFRNGVASGSATVTDQALLDEIRANPGGFYVNIHNGEFPGGAVRGQLATASAFSSELLGGPVEVPPGDPDGLGYSIVAVSGSTVQYFFSTTNINQAAAAHIHRGGPGVAGPIVVGFNTPSTGAASSGTVNVTDEALLNEIRANPTGFYVNVHTADFPG